MGNKYISQITTEEILQKLIALHPELLSICDENSDVSGDWLLIDREIGIPDSDDLKDRWFLDHLFLDEAGIPTLVEVKLARNSRIRRDIVGQIIDYVTYFSKYWSYETIIAVFERRCSRKKINPDLIICNFLKLPLNASTVNTYWEQVKRNIDQQKFRLIFAADFVPQELKDISSFLNSHMPLIEVKFLEMGNYININPHLLTGIKIEKNDKTKKDKNALFNIAVNQAGYFSLAQAKEIGIQRQQIYQGVKTGKFWRTAAGVYRFVQFPASRYENLHIALLKSGENAVLGFQSALYVYELADLIPGEIHLILPRNSSRRRPDIRMHTTHLAEEDITLVDGLRITSVARTISDCAFAFVEEQQIHLAISQALQRGLTTRQQLVAQAMRRSKHVQELILPIVKETARKI